MVLGLRYSADLRTLVFCVFYFTLVFWQWFRDDSSSSKLELVALYWLTTFCAFQGAVSVHNAIHCSPFHASWANRLFSIVLSLWYGHTAAAYGHNLSHHKYLQSTKDIMRTSKMRYNWNILNLLLFMPNTLPATSKNDATYFAVQKELKRPIYQQLRVEMTCYIIVQLVLAYFDPLRWLRVFFGPQLLGKYFIVTLNMLQHDGCDPNSNYNHSRNFTGSILNFLCFNNGYHTIHHLYPGKHWSLLIEEHRVKVHPHIHPNLEQEDLGIYLFHTFIFPGIRLNYDGTPFQLLPEGLLPDEPWFYDMNETISEDRLFLAPVEIMKERKEQERREREKKGIKEVAEPVEEQNRKKDK